MLNEEDQRKNFTDMHTLKDIMIMLAFHIPYWSTQHAWIWRWGAKTYNLHPRLCISQAPFVLTRQALVSLLLVLRDPTRRNQKDYHIRCSSDETPWGGPQTDCASCSLKTWSF